MRKFWILVEKEIRELLTPAFFVPLILTVILFGAIGKIASHENKKSSQPQPIAVLDNDHSALSQAVEQTLSQSNFIVKPVNSTAANDAISQAKTENDVAVIVIPAGFGADVSAGKNQQIAVYSILHNFSVTASRTETIVQAAVSAVNDAVSNQVIAAHIPGVTPQSIKQPIKTQDYVIIGNKQAAVSITQVISFISSQTYFIPIILFIVITFASQMVATSIATEKENKTLETLLSAPVGRRTIVSAKLVAAGLIAALFAGVYMIGFRSYINGFTGGNTNFDAATTAAFHQLGVSLSAGGYMLLGLSLFLGILCALAIALILGAFAEDVKSIQSIMMPLLILVMIPYFLTLLTDFSSFSPIVKWLVYAIPFSHVFLAAQNILLQNYTALIGGLVYLLVVFFIFVSIASWIFSTDHIITMKLNFSKKRR